MTLDPTKVPPVKIVLIRVQAENILNWSYDSYGRLIRVVLRSYSDVRREDGTYIQVPFYRELLIEEGIYKVREYATVSESIPDNTFPSSVKLPSDVRLVREVIPSKSGLPLPYIPFFFVDIKDGNDRPTSPVMNIVYLNIHHYRVAADYAYAAHFTAVPTPYATGVDTSPRSEFLPGEEAQFRELGPNTFYVLKDPNANVRLLEFKGEGLEPNRQILELLQDWMRSTGARLMEGNSKKGVEAAETARYGQLREGSVLSEIISSVSACMRQVLRTVTSWYGFASDAILFELSKDFVADVLPYQLVTVINQLNSEGKLSTKTAREILKRGEVLPSNLISEDEDALILKEAHSEIGAYRKNLISPTVASSEQSPLATSIEESDVVVENGSVEPVDITGK